MLARSEQPLMAKSSCRLDQKIYGIIQVTFYRSVHACHVRGNVLWPCVHSLKDAMRTHLRTITTIASTMTSQAGCSTTSVWTSLGFAYNIDMLPEIKVNV
jgi:hypothetical protein